ncbi:amidohydrolase family protein [Porphyrobacter sp. YT40]|uniref:amidohydrolase family protein n=1 Tax=Porphyrobacter sp. YT40 TaxID=2547601 RepID=UPI0015E89792|nr:amidohydrolase family protein [Porphyrobacter sp. YT40]
MIRQLKDALVVLYCMLLCACVTPIEAGGPVTHFRSGLWWDGSRFVAGDRFVRDGRFVGVDRATRTIDLEGAFVVPPLADGHAHGFDTPELARSDAAEWLRDGIFTVLSLGGPVAELQTARGALEGGAPTVLFAGAMVTSPGGHPIPYYEALAMGLNWWRATQAERERIRGSRLLEGNVYFALGSIADARARWAEIRGTNPDLIKIILDGDNGLATEVAIEVARLAHADGLKMVAHVQTAADVETALMAGADLLAHAPDYDRIADPLPPQLLAKIAARGIPVVPTFAREMAMERWAPPSSRRNEKQIAALQASHRARLQAMHAAGIALVPGADLNGLTALDELAYWQGIGAFDGSTLLALATSGTLEIWAGLDKPCGLSVGCPADFVVIRKNPAEDIAVFQQWSDIYKSGIPVNLGILGGDPSATGKE